MVQWQKGPLLPVLGCCTSTKLRLCGTPTNETVPYGGGFLCAILKFHASGKYAEGVAVEFNHYAGRAAASSRSVHAALLPALRAASHCWSSSVIASSFELILPEYSYHGRTSWTTLVSIAWHSSPREHARPP